MKLALRGGGLVSIFQKKALHNTGTAPYRIYYFLSARNYVAYGCHRSHVQKVTDYLVLDASLKPITSGQPFCRTIQDLTRFNKRRVMTGQAYDASVMLYSFVGAGHAGVMYNVMDEDNFDFVMFRYCIV